MNKNKLIIRYHNPNTDEETLKYIAKLFTEAGRVKFEKMLRKAAANSNTNPVAEKELMKL